MSHYIKREKLNNGFHRKKSTIKTGGRAMGSALKPGLPALSTAQSSSPSQPEKDFKIQIQSYLYSL